MSEVLRGTHCTRTQTADGGLRGQEWMQGDCRASDSDRTRRDRVGANVPGLCLVALGNG